MKKLSELSADEVTDSHLDVEDSHEGSELVDVSLVVQQLAFFFQSVLSLELASDHSVSKGDEQGHAKRPAGFADDLCADHHHDDVEGSQVAGD